MLQWCANSLVSPSMVRELYEVWLAQVTHKSFKVCNQHNVHSSGSSEGYKK